MTETMLSGLDPFDKSTWNEEERRYFSGIDQAMRDGTNVIISNGKVEHAAYLLEKFFRGTKETIRLFSGSLRRNMGGVAVFDHDRILEAAKGLLQRGCEIRVALKDELDTSDGETDSHPLVKMSNELAKSGQMKGRLTIRPANEKGIAFLKERDFLCHWQVMDKLAYRLETEDDEVIKAHVNFGDADTADALADVFDEWLFEPSQNLVCVEPNC